MPDVTPADSNTLTDRIIDAARTCCRRWGFHKVTIDDIAQEAGVSRATLYRIFPGGREVLFDAMRTQRIQRFFEDLDVRLAGAEDLDTLVAAVVAHAIGQLRADTQLQQMMASQPGAVASGLGIDSMPRIIRLATAFLGPRLSRFIDEERSAELAEWVSRVVVSYYLAPSSLIDLGDPQAALAFVRRFVTPAFTVPAH